MDDLWRALRDPRLSTILALAVLAAGGFALLALAWRGTGATLYVVLQLPRLVSGGFAGIALLGLALAALMTHLDRTEAAAERADLASLQRDALRLLTLAGEQPSGGR